MKKIYTKKLINKIYITISSIYLNIFARSYFEKFNKLLFHLSLKGLGFLNYKNSKISGESNFLKNYLSNDKGVLIDVGANEGNYSAEVISLNPKYKVYMLEPHPKTFKRLLSRFNSENVFLFNMGLSSCKSTSKLYDYPNSNGTSHASQFKEVITEIHKLSKDFTGDAISYEIYLETLDEFVQKENIDYINLLKIDTEGNELSILKGAIQTIQKKKIKAIHFEFNEMNVVSRSFLKDFWNILHDYNFYRLLPSGMNFIGNYTPLECEIFAYQNIVAILKE